MTASVGLLLVQQGKLLLVRTAGTDLRLRLPMREMQDHEVFAGDPETLAQRLSNGLFGVASAFVARMAVNCGQLDVVIIADFDSDRPVHTDLGLEVVSIWPHELANFDVCECIQELPLNC